MHSTVVPSPECYRWNRAALGPILTLNQHCQGPNPRVCWRRVRCESVHERLLLVNVRDLAGEAHVTAVGEKCCVVQALLQPPEPPG